MIAFYGRTLKVVLRFQTITLLVALATLVLTVVLYIMIPKGFFPVQDTGVIQGISQAPQSISYTDMATKQQELARIILQDPAVESLSSFIGADGINTTMNSGRISINLKPLDERHISAADVIRRLQTNLGGVQGMHLYMQPVQDITVDDRVSRTQYQYTLEDPDFNELNEWTDKFVAELKKLPELEDVATDQQTGGRALSLNIDRVTASRLGIAPTTIDNTLYDAYGQRQISTLYTQTEPIPRDTGSDARVAEGPLSSWVPLHPGQRVSGRDGRRGVHVVFILGLGGSRFECADDCQSATLPRPVCSPRRPRCWQRTTSTAGSSAPGGTFSGTTPNASVTSTSASAVPLAAFTHASLTTEPLSINHQGQFPSVTVSFNLAPKASLGTAIADIDKLSAADGFPAHDPGRLPGHRGVLPELALERGSVDPCRAGDGLHRAGRFV